MNNINWLEQDTVVQNIKDLIFMKERSIKQCEREMAKYKSKFKTTDKFEACDYEYWRGIKIATESSISDLKELLEDITDVRYEELQVLQEAEEQDRDNRHNAYIGG